MELLLSYLAMWAPSIVAMLGIAATVIAAIGKVKSAIEDLKGKDAISAVIQSEEKITAEISTLIAQNKELAKANKCLVDRITKIQDYVDNAKK